MSRMHFEQIAADYAAARPTYPDELYRALADAGVTGPGRQTLEIGAGAGLATVELLRAGCEVVAVEPGARLVEHLRAVAPGVDVIQCGFEDVDLPGSAFDAVVAATSLHWVDLAVGLPKIHGALRTGGRLAVWRSVFGDDEVDTEFRRRVAAIVARRSSDVQDRRREVRPTVDELSEGGLFELASSDELGGVVTEHYRTVLHLLRRRDRESAVDEPRRVSDPSDGAGRHDA